MRGNGKAWMCREQHGTARQPHSMVGHGFRIAVQGAVKCSKGKVRLSLEEMSAATAWECAETQSYGGARRSQAKQRTHKTTGERSQQDSREGATTETSYTYTDDGKCWFSSDERKTITRIRKLKEAYPDEVTILKQPEENDGCIYGWIDKKQFSLYPNHKMDLSDEQRAKRAESMRERRALLQTGAKEQEDTP